MNAIPKPRPRRARLSIKALDRKLLRDLWNMRSQALAIALVVGASIAVFVSSMATYQSLWKTQRLYYDRFRFADVFAQMKRAPESLAAEIANVPGVSQVMTRVVAEVTIDVPGLAEPATGRLLSIPDDGPPLLSDVFLREGRLPAPRAASEVLASEAFANANNLHPGDRISAVIHGRWQALTIVGVGLSPEYIYQIRPGSLFPDDKRFGVFWMSREAVAAALDMDGAFNDVSLTLAPGASEREVIRRIDQLTSRYGGIGAYGRDKQISNRFISDEIRQLKINAVAIPGIFLAVAAFLLHVVLTRTVGTQRAQIATLKAFGYDDGRIGLHYLQLTISVALVGAIAGAFVGNWLGHSMTKMYATFYHFPFLSFEMHLSDLALAACISIGAAMIGSVSAVRNVVRLPPAAAMQPEPPPSFHRTPLEILGVYRLIGPAGRMIMRNLERRPVRALLSIVAMAFATGILVIGGAQMDAINKIMDLQFGVIQREDVMVMYIEPRGPEARHEIARLPGVLRAEPFRAVGVTLRNGNLTYDAAIMGYQRGAELRRLVDQDLEERVLPAEGLVLTSQLGKILDLRRGDLVTVEVREGRRPILRVRVADFVDELVGVSAYMDLAALNGLMHEGAVSSGAFLSVDPKLESALYARLKATPGVASASVKRVIVESFQKTFAENMNQFRVVIVIFAVIIAFGVVYNAARIALAERARELASLRVLGFSRGEISLILLGELAILTAASIPVGSAIGYGLEAWLVASFATDLFRIPLVVHPESFGFAAVVIATAALVSALVVRRKLDHLDLVEVLKTRE